jgi:hypothetical protein
LTFSTLPQSPTWMFSTQPRNLRRAGFCASSTHDRTHSHRQMSELIMGRAVSSTTLRSRRVSGNRALCRCEAPGGESAWAGSGGTGLVPAWPCGRRSGHVRSEAPYTGRGSARAEGGTFVGGRSSAGGDRLGVMIHQWWSGGRGHSADAIRGSDPSDGAAAGGGR